MSTVAEDDEEDYFLPLQDQRVFGAGLKRKKVAFVPSSSTIKSPDPHASSVQSAGDRYLSIVLTNPTTLEDFPATDEKSLDPSKSSSTNITAQPAPDSPLCPICNLPVLTAQSPTDAPSPSISKVTATTKHESSIAHQVCLEHSHPPSHLDRDRIGLRYLAAYGWDPDSRQGLGAQGEGIRDPIKARVKNDTVGLGVRLDKGEDEEVDLQKRKLRQRRKEREKERENQMKKRLNGKELRKAEAEGKKRDAKLQEQFYSNIDLEKYLGTAV